MLATLSLCSSLLFLSPDARVNDIVDAGEETTVLCDNSAAIDCDSATVECDSISVADCDSTFYYQNPQYSAEHPKRWWVAGTEVIAVNVCNALLNRFAFDFDYSHLSGNTIKDNFQRGFVWDNDDFVINQIGHPYQGSFYYSVSRANGLNYWQSVPFTMLGSVTWEMFCETDPPAFNDLITTTLGGAAIGEMTWRLSDLVLDESTRGFQRVWREATAFVLNPMRGLNRIFYGDAWRHRSTHYKYHDREDFPLQFVAGAGFRHLNNRFDFAHGTNNLQLHVGLEYGDAFSADDVRPYDYFLLEAKLGFFGNQPLLEQFNGMGRIYGKMLTTHRHTKVQMGIYQHFNYYDSNSIEGDDDGSHIPYLISETASFGPGLLVSQPLSDHSVWTSSAHLSGVLLGAVKSDHYGILDRYYNLGSGYSFKGDTHFKWRDRTMLGLTLNHYHIFTWKDYDEDYIATGKDPHYLNSPGNRCRSVVNIARLIFSQKLTKHLTWLIDGSHYFRHTFYKKFEQAKSHSFELSTSLMFSLR